MQDLDIVFLPGRNVRGADCCEEYLSHWRGSVQPVICAIRAACAGEPSVLNFNWQLSSPAIQNVVTAGSRRIYVAANTGPIVLRYIPRAFQTGELTDKGRVVRISGIRGQIGNGRTGNAVPSFIKDRP